MDKSGFFSELNFIDLVRFSRSNCDKKAHEIENYLNIKISVVKLNFTLWLVAIQYVFFKNYLWR